MNTYYLSHLLCAANENHKEEESAKERKKIQQRRIFDI